VHKYTSETLGELKTYYYVVNNVHINRIKLVFVPISFISYTKERYKCWIYNNWNSKMGKH